MIGIYTCLFGPYDDPLPSNFGGTFFTDQNVKPEGWTVRRVKPPVDDPNRSSRYYFCQSCLVVPEFDISVQVMASTQLAMPPERLVAKFLPDGYDIAAFAHPHRDNVYREGHLCGHWRKDYKEVIRAQMNRYRKEGFPGDGLSSCILLIRRNNERIREFEDLWWSEVQRGSRRNQLSFDYCRWKLGLKVARIPGDVNRRGDIIKREKHKMEQRYG